MTFSGKVSMMEQHLQNKGIFVQHQKKGMDGDGKLHVHMGYEIYLFHQGNATMIVGDQVYPLQSGDMMFIPGHVPHIARPDEAAPYIRSVIHFTDRCVKLFPGKIVEPILKLFQHDGLLIHWDLSEQREMEKFISRMETELHRGEFGGETMAAANFSSCWSSLTGSFERCAIRRNIDT